jgi:hypothetical protein
MTETNDVIYKYSQSSCQCNKCDNVEKVEDTDKHPTNMSVYNCDFDCFGDGPFKYAIEPNLKHGYTTLNPELQQQLYSKDFQKIECKNKNDNKGCETVYTSTDPRLVNVPLAQLQTLDRPPFDGSIDLKSIYTDRTLDNYGQNYKSYSDINAGQITYYIDKSREDVFYEPLFNTSAQMVGTLYKDPMGVIKPEYNRYPLKCRDPLNMNKHSGGLSWITDTQSHREDLIALQMRRQNQSRYEPRWTK